MKEEQIRQLYTFPEVKVVEIKARQIVCQSNPNGLDPYEREDW